MTRQILYRLAPSAPHAVERYPRVEDALLKALPAVLRAVVRALGFARAGEWLADHGGVNFNLALRHTKTSGLQPDELRRLRAMLAPHLDANGRCTLPKADKLYRRLRDAQIRQDRGKASIRQLARRYHLTARHIQNICREGEDARQFDLF